MHRVRASLAALAFVLVLVVAAAPGRAERAWAGLHFDVADFKGDFDTRVGRHGYGLSAEGWLAIGRDSPLVPGARGGFAI